MTPDEANQALEAARKEADEAKKRNEEIQRKMTEIATENATLRKREDDVAGQEMAKRAQQEVVQISAECQEIVNEFSGDPAKAAEKLSRLISRTKTESARAAVEEFLPKVQNYVDKREYLTNIRASHPEYKSVEHLMEPFIEAKIKKEKMTLEQATEAAMKEFEPLVKPKPSPIAPAGAGGYMGANPSPAPRALSAEPEVIQRDFNEHSRIETVSEIAERKKWQAGKHITKKP